MRFCRTLPYILVAILLSVTCTAQTPHSVAGHWEGAITLPQGVELAVSIKLLQESAGAWKGFIDIPAQGAKGLALVNITEQDSKASFEIENIPGKPTFAGELSADGESLSGNFSQGGQTFPYGPHGKRIAGGVETPNQLEF